VTATPKPAASLAPGEIPTLLRGEPAPIRAWFEEHSTARIILCVLAIIAGTAAFGAAVGAWRAPLQALYTAVKFPLIILLTALGNGLLNGMLAPLLGTNITFRQSLLAVLMSFTIASVVLGACAPLVWFVIWNSPPFSPDADHASLTTHSFIFVLLAAWMAAAGIAGNVRLYQLLRQLAGSSSSARRTLFAWLAGNLLLGSQLAWMLRPFVGAPHLPVEFLRSTAFEGNFFEMIYRHAKHLLP
jgi:hypothetical protein